MGGVLTFPRCAVVYIHFFIRAEFIMLKYCFQRIFYAIPTLFFIITLSFFLMKVAPGGPFDGERPLPQAVLDNLRAYYNLDKPLHIQYVDYLWGILHFDLGPSYTSRDFSVAELLAKGFPYSLQLGLYSIIFGVVTGVLAGTVSALRQNTWADYTVMTFAMSGVAIPNLVLGPVLIMVFALWVDWFPAGGWGDGGLHNLFLPVITLGTAYTGAFARITRGAMIESLGENHIRTARAKGLPEYLVVWRHALKPALMPVVTLLGPATAGVVTGSVVIESIFGLPGVGQYFVQGALSRDYPLVMGTVIMYGSLIILANLLVDMAYAYLNPQIRLRD